MIEEKIPKSQGELIETEISMGTVHPAALEPYRVRFFVQDEIIQEAEITIGVNHRGVERIMEGLPVEKANALTEKICGICSNAHTWNSVMVAEKGLNIDVPERANYIRVIMGELERLHSHLLYLAHGNEVLGHETFAMRIFYIGGVRPRCQLDDMRIQRLNEGMDKLEKDLTKFTDRFTSDPIVNSRIEGIGILPPKQAKKLGVTGPSLRACGFDYDLRTEMKEYDDFDFNVAVLDGCDVKSNLLLRVLECFESIKIIRQAVRNLPSGPITNRNWEMYDCKAIKHYIEVPRGILYDSYAIEDGRVRSSIIRTPSMTNIGAMQYAAIGNQITDGQLCIVQCDPCFTCTDRTFEIIEL